MWSGLSVGGERAEEIIVNKWDVHDGSLESSDTSLLVDSESINIARVVLIIHTSILMSILFILIFKNISFVYNFEWSLGSLVFFFSLIFEVFYFNEKKISLKDILIYKNFTIYKLYFCFIWKEEYFWTQFFSNTWLIYPIKMKKYLPYNTQEVPKIQSTKNYYI